MISLREARAIIAEHVPILPSKIRPISEAFGRVLHQEVLAPEDIPAFNRSAMDGYALAQGETGDRLKVVGEIAAGAVSGVTLNLGECARILTGAPVPASAGCVLPQEWVDREGEFIAVKKRAEQTFIRKRGEEAKQGDVLLRTGVRLHAGELSLLAQVGATLPIVSSQPRVAHITTGDELVAPEQVPAAGQIRDSNSALIQGLLRECGAELVSQGRCGDDLAALKEAITQATENERCDLLLLSGGASVGDYDFGPQALAELGFTILFRQLEMKPGKPLVFAVRGQLVAFVIPGNPVSHFVTFQVAIRVALERLEDRDPQWPIAEVPLLAPVPAQRDTRETFWPVRLTCSGNRLWAIPLNWQSSGDLRGLVEAGGLLQLLPGTTPLERGQTAPCLLLNLR